MNTPPPMITKWEMVKLIILMNLVRFLSWIRGQLLRAAVWMQKHGAVVKDVSLAFGLLVVLLISMYVGNDCSCRFPHYG